MKSIMSFIATLLRSPWASIRASIRPARPRGWTDRRASLRVKGPQPLRAGLGAADGGGGARVDPGFHGVRPVDRLLHRRDDHRRGEVSQEAAALGFTRAASSALG